MPNPRKYKHNMGLKFIIGLALYCVFCVSCFGGDFFSIKSVRFFKDRNNKGIFVGEVKNSKWVHYSFLELNLSLKEDTNFNDFYVKAYFFDKNKNLLSSLNFPSKAYINYKNIYVSPAVFRKNKVESLFFRLSEEFVSDKDNVAILVVGDDKSAVAFPFPNSAKISNYTYPEKNLVETKSNIKRDKDEYPLVERPIRINSETQPVLTLLFKPIKNPKGIFAACVLANSVEDIKKSILREDGGHGLKDLVAFAKRHNLALLLWGSKSQWNTSKNWDEIDKNDYRDYDRNFNTIAKAWKFEVEKICKEYKIPNNKLVLYGVSGAAQYAKRLALRVPECFSVVCIHVPSSFDKPTENAKNIMWCLTTGELESGYNRSIEFYNESKRLGYPIVYKAIPNLAHKDHDGARKFLLAFCDFALDEKLTKQEKLELLKSPPYYGDIVYQNLYPPKMRNKIATNSVVSLPTQELAKIWVNLQE